MRQQSWTFACLPFANEGNPRSDNGPEFVAEAVQAWITAVGAKTAYIERGSPWENGYIESFNARLRDELLNGEIFYTLREAQIVVESWRRHYSSIRPHASLGYKPPAPEVFVTTFAAWPAALRRPASPATLAQPSRPTWTAPAGCVHQWARVAHGRTRMTVFPARRSVALKVATASSRAETFPMFVRSRPSRTRWTISLSWARSDSTTKSTARPSAGRASAGPTMDTSVPPARIRPADRFWMSPPMTSNTRTTPPTSSRASLSRSTNSCAPKSSAF